MCDLIIILECLQCSKRPHCDGLKPSGGGVVDLIRTSARRETTLIRWVSFGALIRSGSAKYNFPLVQSSEYPCRIAPNRRTQASSLGNILMLFSRRLSSSLRRSNGLVLLILLQCELGNSRYTDISWKVLSNQSRSLFFPLSENEKMVCIVPFVLLELIL